MLPLSCAAAAMAVLLAPQDVDDWIRQLASDDPALRNRGAEALVRLWESDPVKKRVEEFEKRSTDPELKLRAGSIVRRIELRRSLGRPFVDAVGDVEGFLDEGGGKLAAAFLKWFEDPKRIGTEDAERRRIILESVVSRLKTVEDKDKVLDVVMRRLFDVDVGNCQDVLPALWVGGVAPLLKDEAAQVRADAACILGRARAKGFDRAIAAMLSDEAPCCQPSIANCERRPGCGTCGRPPVAAIAAAALADLGVSGAAKDIARLLKHEHSQARLLATRALGTLKATDFVDRIAALLEDRDVRVRVESAQALAQMGAKAFSKKIAALLRLEDPWPRFRALDALVALEAQEQADEIRALLKDPRPGLRAHAARALARLGRKECVDEIAGLLTDDRLFDDRWHSVWPVVEALRSLEAKSAARVLKRAADRHSRDLGSIVMAGKPREGLQTRVTLAELVDETLRDWGIDPESLKD
jgi:HEAT repeat protein